MFTVLIDQTEHLYKSTVQSYCVGQAYVINKITQFSKQKLINKSMCEWSVYKIAPANFTRLLRMSQILFAWRLSTTPTQKLIRYAILGQTGPPRRVNYLAPLWKYGR